MTKLLWRFLMVVLALSLWGQEGPLPSLGPQPQAKTQQEFDDWLDLLESASPETTVRRVDEFVAKYPQTEFAGRAYQAQMLAYQQMDNYEGTVAAGKKALEFSPDNLDVLATLANVIPHGVPPGHPKDARLDEAAGHARRLLRRLADRKIPRTLPLNEWKQMKLRLEVSARAALGLVMLLRGQVEGAIRELEWVTQQDPVADGVQFLRLGSAYLATKNYCAAWRGFERAAILGPQPVRQKAEEAKLSISRMAAGCAQGAACMLHLDSWPAPYGLLIVCYQLPDTLRRSPGTPPVPAPPPRGFPL